MSEDGKYHINPQTGNVNKCVATYNCKFNMNKSQHYETKEEAQQASEENLTAEFMDEDKVVKELSTLPEHFENDNRDFDAIKFHTKLIKEWNHSGWTKEEKQNLYRTQQLAKLVKKEGNLTDEEWSKADDLISKLHPIPDPGKYQSTLFSSNTINEYQRRDSNIVGLAETLYWKKRAEEIPAPEPVEKRVPNENIMGLREAQLANFEKYNDPGYDFLEGTELGDNAKDYFDETIDRVIAGQEYKSVNPDKDGGDAYITPKHDRFMRALDGDNQLYMATVFPDRELKDSMEKASVDNVTVTSFYNTREWGNAYTVLQPDGSTRTFAVYEHRNTDSIIINGKENWKNENNELPYAGDSKEMFFDEIPPDERKRAADNLVFFMKAAQNGDLASDGTLSRNASRRDWTSILSEQIPGFAEWHKEHSPESYPEDKGSEEDLLRNLDFEVEDDGY